MTTHRENARRLSTTYNIGLLHNWRNMLPQISQISQMF